jgi:hypothetical protein
VKVPFPITWRILKGFMTFGHEFLNRPEDRLPIIYHFKDLLTFENFLGRRWGTEPSDKGILNRVSPNIWGNWNQFEWFGILDPNTCIPGHPVHYDVPVFLL